jgi:hypothetical protein
VEDIVGKDHENYSYLGKAAYGENFMDASMIDPRNEDISV